MKNFILNLVFAILLLIVGKVASQTTYTSQLKPLDWECGSMRLLGNNLAADISIDTAFSLFNTQVNLIINNSSSMSPPLTPYIIPVVFHVIQDATFSTPIPTYAQIQWQLATLNAAFSNSLSSLNGVATGSHAVNTQIQFCLAKNMQAGSPTPMPNVVTAPGVINYTTSNTSFISNIVMNNTVSLQALAALTNYTLLFPPNMYLNIFCVPNITNLLTGYNINDPPSLIGIGTFPWANMIIDGVIMRNDCIGNNTYNNFSMFPPLNKGNILAHEVGHYLGLFHTFESITSGIGTANGSPGCYGTNSITAYTHGDLVFDTPPTQINGAIGLGPINTCAETYSPYALAADESDQLENFMTYSDDEMMTTFTFNQAERMWAALDGTQPPATFLSAQRSNLVTAANLSLTGVTDSPACGLCVASSAFSSSLMASSITCSTAAYQFQVPILPTYICANTYTWNFGDGGTSNLPNPVHTFTNSSVTFTVQLSVTNGGTVSSQSQVLTIPNGFPKIVGQSGNKNPVCKGTEQTILIEFPAYSTSALITDGTNYYTVTNNAPHTCTSPPGVYKYPFLFTINNSGSYSLVPANCGTLSTGVATFTVLDCCSNLVNNGDFESGLAGGYYSDYTLTATIPVNGQAMLGNPPFTGTGSTGKAFYVDSYAHNTFTTCPSPGASFLLLGQAVTGLKPSTNYYISFKCNQSHDTVTGLGCQKPVKFNIKFFESGGTLLNKNIVPSTVPPSFGGGGCLLTPGIIHGSLNTHNFAVTTSSSINTSTSFSLEISEIENFGGWGFDDLIDNIMISEMNPPILISPSSPTVCPGSTVQLTASNNCVNIANYSLSWLPASAMSCSSCANPIVTPTATSIYTLIAVPPLTTPPTANIILTTTVFVANMNIIAQSSTATPCFPSATYTLLAGGGATSATWQPMGLNTLSVSVTPTTPTIYTLTSVSGSCQQTNTLYIGSFTINASGTSSICANLGETAVISASTSNNATLNYAWQPGGLSGPVHTVTPSSNTTYTLIASLGSCTIGATVPVSVLHTCCPQGITVFSAPTITSLASFFGPMVITSDFTVQSGATLVMSGNFLFSHNAKITIDPGADISLQGAYLHSCGSDMWQGIVIKDGAAFASWSGNGLDNLIEDAVIAIDASNQYVSSMGLVVTNTTFNKNHTDIRFTGYTLTPVNNPFYIQHSVFTCRDFGLPMLTGTWPKTGTISASSNAAADLRYASSPTTGLAPPYLNQSTFTITTLKNPYAGKYSNEAIHLENVGNYNGGLFYGMNIGETSIADNFNVFDAHNTFIYAHNSNVYSRNNVFQNTTSHSLVSFNGFGIPAAAIVYTASPTFIGRLDLDAPDVYRGNRFWNCHRGVYAFKAFSFKIQHGIFRSTQTTADAFTIQKGNMGICLRANAFDYYIGNSEFTNINNGINVSLTIGGVNSNFPSIHCVGLRVHENIFSAGTPTNNQFMNRALYIGAPNNVPWTAPIATVFPNPHIVAITQNTLDNVLRGVSLNGLYGVGSSVTNNSITLTNDNVFIANQSGIEQVNSNATSSLGIATNMISNNNLSFSAPNATLNPLATLIFCANGPGIRTQSVTCNQLAQAYQSIVFDGSNYGTIWAGNSMSLPIAKGLVLKNAGIIGPQGAGNIDFNNLWAGGSWSSSNGNYATYVGSNSNATLSPLYVQNPLATPPTNTGSVGPLEIYGSPNTLFPLNPTGSSSYDCGGVPNNMVVSLPDGADYSSTDQYYMAQTGWYRFFHANDSLVTYDTNCDVFYTNLAGSSIGKFMQVEESLYADDYATARSINDAIDASATAVETNYKLFYGLFANYMEDLVNSIPFANTDSSALHGLASLCPGTSGACIYQARALYNEIYGQVPETADCENAGARKIVNDLEDKRSIPVNNRWSVELFPNPASSQVTIVGKQESQVLILVIKDLTGRIILKEKLKTTSFFSTLDLNLINGAYIVSVSNEANETIVKKLLISK